MFGGGSSNSPSSKPDTTVTTKSPDSNSSSPSPSSSPDKYKASSPDRKLGTSPTSSSVPIKPTQDAASGEKRCGNSSPPGRRNPDTEKKRRSSGVGSKASNLIASARNSLNFGQVGRSNSDASAHTPIQKLGKQDQSLAVPQGQHNNSAGESLPGPRSTFRVGVWEDRNKKCRRTMEDTHAFLYNFLHTPAPLLAADASNKSTKSLKSATSNEVATSEASGAQDMVETDNGYFAIFDGHAGTFAADWCGKKLHLILEDIIRRNPNVPIPELLDQTFTSVDSHLEKLPVKNSGCTAAIAVLRWEDRVPSTNSATGSQAIAPAAAAASRPVETQKPKDGKTADETNTSTGPNSKSNGNGGTTAISETHSKLKNTAARQRVLYTANVGDARIVLCRSGKALRLSYDHKGSDENEGRRIANAGGLILNNRVNGVLAVTRALGDSYMKDLVTGHPYTTETVIQPEMDEFVIIACDGIWDVCSDQEAVDLVREMQDPVSASKFLVDHALSRFSTDNLSCMIVRFDKAALLQSQSDRENPIGVEGDSADTGSKVSEADKIVNATRQKIAEGDTPAVGVSASNSGRGHEPVAIENTDTSTTGEPFKRTLINSSVEEEPASIDEPESDDSETKPSDTETNPPAPANDDTTTKS